MIWETVRTTVLVNRGNAADITNLIFRFLISASKLSSCRVILSVFLASILLKFNAYIWPVRIRMIVLTLRCSWHCNEYLREMANDEKLAGWKWWYRRGMVMMKNYLYKAGVSPHEWSLTFTTFQCSLFRRIYVIRDTFKDTRLRISSAVGLG